MDEDRTRVQRSARTHARTGDARVSDMFVSVSLMSRRASHRLGVTLSTTRCCCDPAGTSHLHTRVTRGQ